MIFNGKKILFLGDCRSGLLNGILQYVIDNCIKVSKVWTLFIIIAHSFHGSNGYLTKFNYKSYWNENKTSNTCCPTRAAWNIRL